MTTIVTVKMTSAEVQVLEWLTQTRDATGRSEAIRSAVIDAAMRLRAPADLVSQALQERAAIGTDNGLLNDFPVGKVHPKPLTVRRRSRTRK
jgi:hypothetical protein